MKGTFKKRGEAYMKKDATAQKSHGVAREPQVVFPQKKIPLRGRLAVWLLRNCQARVLDGLKDLKKVTKNGNNTKAS